MVKGLKTSSSEFSIGFLYLQQLKKRDVDSKLFYSVDLSKFVTILLSHVVVF